MSVVGEDRVDLDVVVDGRLGRLMMTTEPNVVSAPSLQRVGFGLDRGEVESTEGSARVVVLLDVYLASFGSNVGVYILHPPINSSCLYPHANTYLLFMAISACDTRGGRSPNACDHVVCAVFAERARATDGMTASPGIGLRSVTVSRQSLTRYTFPHQNSPQPPLEPLWRCRRSSSQTSGRDLAPSFRQS